MLSSVWEVEFKTNSDRKVWKAKDRERVRCETLASVARWERPPELHTPTSDYLACDNSKQLLLPLWMERNQNSCRRQLLPWSSDCCWVWRTLPRLPTADTGKLFATPPSSPGVRVNLRDCSGSHIWAVPTGNSSPSSQLRPNRFWPQPGLCPSSHRPQMAYVRQTKKETDFDQKKKKFGRVYSNSWVRRGESQPVFQACCVLTHHCQDRDLCFSGLHPSCS